jgi:diguanylate cyclase (GGDEF)-like protein
MPSFKRDRPTIGVLPAWSPLIGNTPDRYLAAVLDGIQSAARVKQCHLLMAWGIRQGTVEAADLFPSWPVVSNDSDFVPVGPWNTDGLIVLAPLRNERRSKYLHELSDQGFPILYVATGEDGPTIAAGNESGIHQAIEHLVQHGHRRIAFIAGDPNDNGDSESRLRAYHSAVAEFGLATDPRLVEPGWHMEFLGYDALKKLLASKVGFTAVAVSDDWSAVGAMRAIREAGLAVPGDIAVIGFDDQPEALAQIPPLASVHVPLPEMGQQAVLLMLDHLFGGHPLETIHIPTRLVPRHSCGCMPAGVLSAAHGEQELPSYSPKSETTTARTNRIKLHVVNEMVATLPAESRMPEEEVTRALCDSLVESFYASLKQGDTSPFQRALMDLLQKTELLDLNMDFWQEIVSILRRQMTQLPLGWKQLKTRRLAEDLLHQARAAISESAQRRDQRHQLERDSHAHLLGVLTSRLSGTLDVKQVVQVLNENLANVGVRHARVAVFEPEGDDPVAWSILLDRDPESPLRRFPTREFPPPELYPPGELLNLALLPLLFQNEAMGYVAFDGHDLSACTSIARQIAAALKVSSLHGQVVELSLTDPLTGLHNRRYFELFLKNEVVRSQRFGRALAILMIDFDGFKTYNDMYGHPAGDVALQKVAASLLEGRRSADVVARIGGDEFAIILPETEVNGALLVAKRIREAVAALNGLKRPISLSIGVTAPATIQVSPEELVKEADQALYQSKHEGRDRTSVFLDGEGS